MVIVRGDDAVLRMIVTVPAVRGAVPVRIARRAIHQVADGVPGPVLDDEARRPVVKFAQQEAHIARGQFLANEPIDFALEFEIAETMRRAQAAKL